MISTNQTGAVRCCSIDGASCTSPDCFTLGTLTFSKAQQKCSEFGMRLCTEKELDSMMCCGKGCGFDFEMVWFEKGNMFAQLSGFWILAQVKMYWFFCSHAKISGFFACEQKNL